MHHICNVDSTINKPNIIHQQFFFRQNSSTIYYPKKKKLNYYKVIQFILHSIIMIHKLNYLYLLKSNYRKKKKKNAHHK